MYWDVRKSLLGRYFVSRADASHTRQTSRLIHRSFFRPLTRVRYDVVGQDWALEQLFRVLSMHSQRLAVAPIVVLLCGKDVRFLSVQSNSMIPCRTQWSREELVGAEM